ncbi:MAG: DUF2851 family protein [Dehalococcoidales bacterium]|nr:DUF2851 family protein [Dehalococcoidales bacterium]
MKNKTGPVPEKQVVGLWQKRMRRQRTVTGTDGETLEVLYPGRLNDGRGGDFRDAVVSAGSRLNYGCIEIHSRAADWRLHGHQDDPHYNKVILHVALEGDDRGETVRQDGVVVPTVILKGNKLPQSTKNIRAGPLPSCRAGGRKRKAVKTILVLEKAGLERFALKTERLRQGLQDHNAGQCLYLGIMEALGYNKNGSQFLRLGRLFPLSKAGVLAEGSDPKRSLELLQASLLGTAGLLPSQGGLSSGEDPFLRTLEKIWSGIPGGTAMSRQEWELFRVRPGNSPVLRILALGHLLVRFRTEGWQQSLESLMLEAQHSLDFKAIESALVVKSGAYRAGHYYPCPSPGSGGLTLLGKERAAEIIINVLLPYLRAGAESGRLPVTLSRTSRMFSLYPRLESNSIERHMLAQLGLNAGQVNTACLQQGLIHIYRQFCVLGKCGECPLAEYSCHIPA